jgi:hypothetical protein
LCKISSHQRRFAPTEGWPISIGTSGRFGAEQLAEFSGISKQPWSFAVVPLASSVVLYHATYHILVKYIKWQTYILVKYINMLQFHTAVNKDSLKQIVLEQREVFERDYKIVDRRIAENLIKSKKIVVVTGVRRCGKSTLLRQISKMFGAYCLPLFQP